MRSMTAYEDLAKNHGETPAVEASVRDAVSAEEWALRVELAAAYRLVAHFGWDDLIFTHLSARVPGTDSHFLLNPMDLTFDEITASNLVKVDLEGKAVMPTAHVTNPAGFVIHSALHRARPDAHAVMHLHTPHGQAVCAHAAGLLPLTQTAMTMGNDLAFHDYEGIAVDLAERDRLVADMGERHFLLLRNHGTLTVGETVGEAFVRLYFFERACQAQVFALAAGTDHLHYPKPEVAELTARQGQSGLKTIANKFAWPALLRKAYRLDPGFAV